MNGPQIRIYPAGTTLYRAAADEIVNILHSVLSVNQWASLVLTGGSTPKPVYELLAEARQPVDWARVHFFWGDERCVPPDHPESNFGMARDSLLSKIRAVPDNIHRMFGELEDVDKAARRYEAEILRNVPAPPVPSFDLVLLGLGDDGHTASLFPETEWDEQRLVVANYVPKLESRRLTMTPRLLNASKTILFLVSGPAKARAVAGVLQETGECPAKRIRPVNGRLTWMLDASAASLL